MFPVEQEASEDGEDTDDEVIGQLQASAVVAASFAGQQLQNLRDDVIITIDLGVQNYSNISCVSWDFTANGKSNNEMPDQLVHEALSCLLL